MLATAMFHPMETVIIIPQERIQQRTVEEMVDIAVPQVVDEFVDVLQTIHQERTSERIVVQIAYVPVKWPSLFRWTECNNGPSNKFWNGQVKKMFLKSVFLK